MRHAIVVKHLPAVNTRPERWQAQTVHHSITVDRNHNVEPEIDCRNAAQALIDQLKWPNIIGACGILPDENYVFLLERK